MISKGQTHARGDGWSSKWKLLASLWANPCAWGWLDRGDQARPDGTRQIHARGDGWNPTGDDFDRYEANPCAWGWLALVTSGFCRQRGDQGEVMAKKKVEPVEPTRTIESIIPCSGDFRAVLNSEGSPNYIRVACWALVTETTSRETDTIVIGMIAADRTVDANPAILIFCDEDEDFVGVCSPGDTPEHWELVCKDLEKNAVASGENDDEEDPE